MRAVVLTLIASQVPIESTRLSTHEPQPAAILWYGQHLEPWSITILTLPIAESIVKVPQMAESISEGTLKQWSKRESTRYLRQYTSRRPFADIFLHCRGW